MSRLPVVWIYGPPGVGKSVTAWRIYLDLVRQGREVAHVDIDQLGMVSPADPADPERHRLKGSALAAITPHYAEAGAEVLIVSGVIDPSLIEWHADQLAATDLVFCRLSVDDAELDRRLQERGMTRSERDDALRASRAMEQTRLPHPMVVSQGRPVAEVAGEVWRCVGSLPSTRSHESPASLQRGVPARATSHARAAWICGTQGVGKSAVAWELFTAVCRRATTAYIDTAQVGFIGDPTAPAAHPLRSAVVGSLWDCFRAAGATRLVLAGTVETTEEVMLYRRALPDVELTVVRVRADRDELAARHLARGRGQGPRLAGDGLLGQSAEFLGHATMQSLRQQEQNDSASAADVDLDTTGMTAVAAAAALAATVT